jgi:hypothetical protein
MKLVNKFSMNLIMLMLLSSAAIFFAQTPESQTLKFTLAIEEKPLEAENAPGTHILLVKYTNISDTVQRDDCAVSPWEYKLLVLRDGVTLKKKKVRREKTEESAPPGAIKLEIHERSICHSDGKGLNPGQSVQFPLWVSSEYDMTAPGTYDITVTRETDPWNPEKSVTVKSNTLTIVVPDAATDAPQ